METSILDAAATEQQALEKQLAKLDADHATKRKAIVEKLQAVKALRLAYGAADAAPASQPALTGFPVVSGVPIPPARENSHKARVLAAAETILGKAGSLRTPALLEQIEGLGVEFRAANKAGNLSVILSKDPRFVSDRRTGWSLAQKTPQDAATSAGSLPT